MIKRMSISETRTRLTGLERDMSAEDTISVTNRGKEVFAILRWDTYEAIAETLDILADDQASSALRLGLKQLADGDLIDLDELKRELNV